MCFFLCNKGVLPKFNDKVTAFFHNIDICVSKKSLNDAIFFDVG